jgi:peptidoglycan hydrolase-like protein with peptidoglycan-binding domain
MPTSHDNNKSAIMNLQRYLRQISYDKSITRPPVDGIYDSDTTQSVKDFQRLYELPETGIVDQATWELIFAAYRASLGRNAPNIPMYLFPRVPEGYEIKKGDQSFVVAAVQYMLSELQFNYENLGAIEITGIYDENTENAVRAFQLQNVLPRNDRVGKETWDELTDQYNILFSHYERQ